MLLMSSSTNFTSGNKDLYAAAAWGSMSLAQTISTPAFCTPQSKPPHPENKETAVSLLLIPQPSREVIQNFGENIAGFAMFWPQNFTAKLFRKFPASWPQGSKKCLCLLH
jgi:hypothetical protein